MNTGQSLSRSYPGSTMCKIPLVSLLGTFLMATIFLAFTGCQPSYDSASPPVASTNAPGGVDIPSFPWPPPEASASMDLPSKFFVGVTNLHQVDGKLSDALLSCEYAEKSYYSVPGGFALVTRLEQINADGTPKALQDRWSVKTSPMRDFSLSAYIKALFGARPGRFRIIVFVVTDHAFSQAPVPLKREEAMAWLPAGLNRLPPSIGQLSYSPSHSCSALIYEFELAENAQEAVATRPSSLSGESHLTKAMLWQYLNR